MIRAIFMSNSLIRPLLAASLAVSAHASDVAVLTTSLPPIPDACGFAGAFIGICGHQLLAGGGANFPDGVMPWKGGKKVWHDTLFSIDLTARDRGWKIIGHLPAANGYGVSLTVPEGIVLVGGGDANRHFKDTWLLRLMENGQPSFRPLPALPSAMAQMSGALVGRKIHLCGGIEKSDATQASNAHWVLDLDGLEKGWQTAPPLPAEGRILATAAAIDDSFYFIGGCSLAADANGKPARTYLRDAWKFTAGQWSRVADLPYPLVASASPAPVSGQSIFMVSGDDGTQANLASPEDHKGFSNKVLRYESAKDTWSSAGKISLPAPVTVAVTPWKDGFIFFNGEVKPGIRTPQVFILTPPPIF